MEQETTVLKAVSDRPSIFRIAGVVLLADFIVCLMYGITLGIGGNLDAQMNAAKPFLITIGCLSLFCGFLLYRRQDKIITEIVITQREITFTAPYAPQKWHPLSPDAESFTVTCPVEGIRLAVRKGRDVILTAADGNRYILVRMPDPDHLVKLMNDKIGE